MKVEKNNSYRIDRRSFLKLTIAGFTASLIPIFGNSTIKGETVNHPTRYGFLYDSSQCIHCNLCHFACKIIHGFPKSKVDSELSPINWLYVSDVHIDGSTESEVGIRYSCMHCGDAMCELACPVGAIQKWNGLVHIDPDRCLGCAYCVNACPYGRPKRAEEENGENETIHGVTRKCDGCFERVQDGNLPACVNACPRDALTFGSREELVEIANNRVAQNSDMKIYGLNEFGGLGVIYIFPKELDPVKDAGFPEVVSEEYMPAAYRVAPMLAAAGIGGVALQLGLRSNRSKNTHNDTEITTKESEAPVSETEESPTKSEAPVSEAEEPLSESKTQASDTDTTTTNVENQSTDSNYPKEDSEASNNEKNMSTKTELNENQEDN